MIFRAIERIRAFVPTIGTFASALFTFHGSSSLQRSESSKISRNAASLMQKLSSLSGIQDDRSKSGR
jgi:hypothetical protein